MTALILFALPALAQDAPTTRQMLTEGRQWLAQGQRDQALKAYQAALDLAANDNDRAQALLGMADVYRTQQDEASQLQRLRQVEALPASDPAYVKAARRQMLLLYRGTGDLAAARLVADKLLAEAKTPEERLSVSLDLAEMDLREGKPADVTRRLEPLLKEAQDSPRLPDLYAALIAARILANRWPEAVALARQALQRFPDRIDLALGAAQMLEERHRSDDAATLLQEALLARPDQSDVLRALYDLRHRSGQVKRLTDWLGQQARGAAREMWLRHQARVYQWDEQLPQAVEVYRQLVALHPDDVPLLQSAGQLALSAQDFAQAAGWFQQALALAPQDEGLIVSLGEVQLRQGQLQQALATWKQGLGYEPRRPESVQRLGGLLAQHELYEAALEVYREARQASGQRTAYALNMGSAYEQLGHVPEAVREYAVALTTRDRMQTTFAAAQQLYHMADEDPARPEVVAALQVAREQGTLPPEGLGVLLYAQALQGDDTAKLLAGIPAGEQADARDWVSVLLRVASRLEARERPDAALPFYQRVMQDALPADQAAVMALRVAETQLRADDWRGALATLKPWVQPASPPALPVDLRARLATQLGSVLLRYARQPADAMGAFEVAAQAAPETQWARRAQWGQGDALFALGEYSQALEEYDRLVRLGEMRMAPEPPHVPGMGRAYTGKPLPQADYVDYQRAEALLRQGKLEEAAPAFHKLAAEHPGSAYANDAMRRMLLVQRLQQDPQREAVLQAVTAWARGDVAATEKLLTQLIAQTPPSKLLDLALMQTAELRVWQGDVPAALQAYDQLLAQCADSALAPRAAFAGAMLVGKTDRAGAVTRLKALIAQYADAPEAEEARLVVQAWDHRKE